MLALLHNEKTEMQNTRVLYTGPAVSRVEPESGCSAEALPLPMCPQPGVGALLLPTTLGGEQVPLPTITSCLPFPLTPFPHTVAGGCTAPGPFLSLVPTHHLPHHPHHCSQHEDAWSWSTLCQHSPCSSLAIPPQPHTHTHTFSVATTLNSFSCQSLPFWRACSWIVLVALTA